MTGDAPPVSPPSEYQAAISAGYDLLAVLYSCWILAKIPSVFRSLNPTATSLFGGNKMFNQSALGVQSDAGPLENPSNRQFPNPDG